MPNIKSIRNVGNEKVSSLPERIEGRLRDRIKMSNLKIIVCQKNLLPSNFSSQEESEINKSYYGTGRPSF